MSTDTKRTDFIASSVHVALLILGFLQVLKWFLIDAGAWLVWFRGWWAQTWP